MAVGSTQFRDQRGRWLRGLRAAAILTLAIAQHAFAAPPEPAIFDWNHRLVDAAVDSEILPVPHPGGDDAAGSPWFTQWVYPMMYQSGMPMSLMLRDDTSPLCGEEQDSLETVLNYLATPLEYVFADIEEVPCVDDAVLNMVNQVRAHPIHNAAYCGAYPYYPGPVDRSMHWPDEINRLDRHNMYLNSGLDVAMPNCYPYGFIATHADPLIWGTNVAPNLRSALFWAPLERFSTAKRHLPEGHLLIPWVCGYYPWFGYPVQVPPKRDMRALIKHMRLRGADGYYTLVAGIEELPDWWTGEAPQGWYSYSYQQYRKDLLRAWKSLNFVFKDRPPKVLNLKTDKTGGVQASGMVFGPHYNRVVIFISNMQSGAAVRVRLPKINGLPKYVDVACSQTSGGHFQKTFNVPPVNVQALPQWPQPRAGDVNGDRKVNAIDMARVMAAWGNCPTPRCTKVCPADLNYDGRVDRDDVEIVRANWTGD